MAHPSGSLGFDNSMMPLEPKQSPEREISDLRRGKMLLELDLNDPPVPPDYGRAQANVHRPVEAQTSKDFEVIDDDVAIISSRIFAEAKNNPTRNLEVRDAVESGTEVNNNLTDASTSYPVHRNKRRRSSRNQAVLNWELYMNSEEDPKAQTKNESTLPAPEAPSFNCPICIGPITEATSTKCGHVFCKKCIEAAIKVQKKCPTCRHKLRMKDMLRIYLPTSI